MNIKFLTISKITLQLLLTVVYINLAIPYLYSDNIQSSNGSLKNICDDPKPISFTNPSVKPTIIVTYPTAGQKWRSNQQYTIQWNYAGKLDSRVKILLLNQRKKKRHIISEIHLLKLKKYTWTVPDFLKSGYYYIRIKSYNQRTFGDSGLIFIHTTLKKGQRQQNLSFKPSSLSPQIKIIQPSENNIWYAGDSYSIQWDNTFTKNKAVRVDLYDAAGKKFLENIHVTRFLRNDTNDIRRINWKIDKKRKGFFTLRIALIDGKLWSQSEKFKVIAKPTLFSQNLVKKRDYCDMTDLKITYPKQMEIYIGEPFLVAWTTSASRDCPIVITYEDHYKGNVFHTWETKNRGSLKVILPSSIYMYSYNFVRRSGYLRVRNKSNKEQYKLIEIVIKKPDRIPEGACQGQSSCLEFKDYWTDLEVRRFNVWPSKEKDTYHYLAVWKNNGPRCLKNVRWRIYETATKRTVKWGSYVAAGGSNHFVVMGCEVKEERGVIHKSEVKSFQSHPKGKKTRITFVINFPKQEEEIVGYDNNVSYPGDLVWYNDWPKK